MSEEYITNPNTNRPCKVGGRVWRRLVKQGLITETEYEDPNVLGEVGSNDEQELIDEFNEELSDDTQAVRGRGKYKNKIVKRKKQFHEQSARKAVKKTGRKLKNREVYEELQESNDFESELERLIMNEINNPTQNHIENAQMGDQPYESESEEEDEPQHYDYYMEANGMDDNNNNSDDDSDSDYDWE